MAVIREEAIRLASDFANANGYRMVKSFDGVPWVHNPRPVKLDAVRWIDEEWSVLFKYLLHPEVLAECTGDICVIVSPDDGSCRFYPML